MPLWMSRPAGDAVKESSRRLTPAPTAAYGCGTDARHSPGTGTQGHSMTLIRRGSPWPFLLLALAAALAACGGSSSTDAPPTALASPPPTVVTSGGAEDALAASMLMTRSDVPEDWLEKKKTADETTILAEVCGRNDQRGTTGRAAGDDFLFDGQSPAVSEVRHGVRR